MTRRHQAEGDALLEPVIKRLLIEQHIVVSKLFVEPILHLLDTAHNTINITVARC
jgi:hypothetical protein